MDRVAPLGPVYQAGTFSGNPVSMRAGAAALEVYGSAGFYQGLERVAEVLVQGLRRLGLTAQAVGSMFFLGFGPERVRDHRDAARLDGERYARLFHWLLEEGIYLPPSPYDAACLMAPHTEEDMERVLGAVRRWLTEESTAALQKTPWEASL